MMQVWLGMDFKSTRSIQNFPRNPMELKFLFHVVAHAHKSMKNWNNSILKIQISASAVLIHPKSVQYLLATYTI